MFGFGLVMTLGKFGLMPVVCGAVNSPERDVDDGAAINVVGNHIEVWVFVAVGTTLVGAATVGLVEVGGSCSSEVEAEGVETKEVGTSVGVAVGRVSFVVGAVAVRDDGRLVGGAEVGSVAFEVASVEAVNCVDAESVGVVCALEIIDPLVDAASVEVGSDEVSEMVVADSVG